MHPRLRLLCSWALVMLAAVACACDRREDAAVGPTAAPTFLETLRPVWTAGVRCPVAVGGSVVGFDLEGRFVRVDERTGSHRYASEQRYLEEGIYPDCHRVGDLVLLEQTLPSLRLVAFDPVSLLERWRRAYVEPGYWSTAARGGRFILFGTTAIALPPEPDHLGFLAVDSADGRVAWGANLARRGHGVPRGVPLACGDAFILPDQGKEAMSWRLVALDAATGKERWSYETPPDPTPRFGAPRPEQLAVTCAGDRLAVAVEHDGIRVVRAADGAEDARHRIPDLEVVGDSLAASGSLLVWAQGEGPSMEVDAVALTSGRVLWRQRQPGLCAAPQRVLIDDDAVYLLGNENVALQRRDGRVGKVWSGLGWGGEQITAEHRLLVRTPEGIAALARDGAVPFGERATIRGTAAPGLDVCIGGVTVPTDSQGHFALTAEVANAIQPFVFDPGRTFCRGNHPILFKNGGVEPVKLNGSGLYRIDLTCG